MSHSVRATASTKSDDVGHEIVAALHMTLGYGVTLSRLCIHVNNVQAQPFRARKEVPMTGAKKHKEKGKREVGEKPERTKLKRTMQKHGQWQNWQKNNTNEKIRKWKNETRRKMEDNEIETKKTERPWKYLFSNSEEAKWEEQQKENRIETKTEKHFFNKIEKLKLKGIWEAQKYKKKIKRKKNILSQSRCETNAKKRKTGNR